MPEISMLSEAANNIFSFLPAGFPHLNLLVAFGVLLAFGTLGGLLAARVRWLPTITGFMALGLLVGPSGIGLLSKEVLQDTRPLVQIALGLILFKLGSTLHPWAIARNRALVVSALVESVVTFGAIYALLAWTGAPPVVSIIAASIAVSSSPAVLIHVAEELRAQGPSMDAAQALVAMNNIFSFVLFSFSLPLALNQAEGFDAMSALLLPLYQMVGAVLVALVVAWVTTRIALLTRVDEQHFRFSLVVGAVILALGIAMTLNVSTLFAALTLGVACRWMQGKSRLARIEFGEGGDLFFIILFAYAGANLHIHDLMGSAGIALAFVAVRALAKAASIYSCGRIFGYTRQQSLSIGLLLVPMAGLAIGLVQTTTDMVPEVAAQISVVVFGAVAVFETIGPPLTAFALRFAGEAGMAPNADDDDEDKGSSTATTTAAASPAQPGQLTHSKTESV
ncbi:MAG: cation:proton antiporter [Burkholderiaceae bacterium]